MKREDAIERILTYLTFSESWSIWDEPGNDSTLDELPEEQIKYLALPLNYFNGAQLFGNDLIDDGAFGRQDMFFDPRHEDNAELKTMNLGLWSSAMIGLPTHGHLPQLAGATCLYHIGKFRKMPLSEVRGVFRLKTGDLGEWSHAWIYNNVVYRTHREICERWGDQWYAIGQPRPVVPETSEDLTAAIFAAKSTAFSGYYDWNVEIGFEMPGRTSLPTVSIATSAEGARSACRLRDVAPGKSRRDALKHWVSTYLRHGTKYDPEAEIKVWAHLRGVEEFKHNGLACRLHPSQYDLKKAAEYQRLREEEKKSARRKVS